MGPSLSTGENAAGRVRFQPAETARERRKACRGPGWITAAKARPPPRRR
jgi:hypothetical protein